MANPTAATGNEELAEQIGQLTQEIRLLRGDLFHYFEVFTRMNTNDPAAALHPTISTLSASTTTATIGNSTNVVVLDTNEVNNRIVQVELEDHKDDDNIDDDDDEDDDDGYEINSGAIMVPRIITSCDNEYVTISSNDILNYICETGRLKKPIVFSKISKKRSRGRAGLPKEASKKAKIKRLDYIHSIHNCVTKHFRLPLIRETFTTPSAALKDPQIFSAVQFIVGAYMDIFASFKYTGLDASVIKADLKENIRDTLRVKRDRSSRGRSGDTASTPRTPQSRTSKPASGSDEDSLDDDESSSDDEVSEQPTKKRKKSSNANLSTEPSNITSIHLPIDEQVGDLLFPLSHNPDIVIISNCLLLHGVILMF